LAQYAVFAEGYYVKNGQPTKQLERVKRSLRFVKELYGYSKAATFGPLALKAIREQMIAKDWARSHVNDCCGCIKRCFKWGVENELVPPIVYQALQCVAGLKRGRSAAREGNKVLPVPEEVVDATLPYMLTPVQAMVKLQRLTGMRPGEVVIMRPCDIDRSKGHVWIFRPESHKTEHHGIDRIVVLGPQAQVILSPFLFRDPGRYNFSPREGMEQRWHELRAKRKSKVPPSQTCRKKQSPRKTASDRYDVHAYNHAVKRAITAANKARACELCKPLKPAERCEQCKAAAMPHWHVHQLRHSAATLIRRRFGLDSAQVVLGHASANITQVYAEADMALAERVAREIG
jgi:integrase